MKIRKLEVALGVEWIEVEEADLRILCGCPADVVKHLMRRGLISKTVVDDVECETGPNAILLADEMLQRGDFSNLAEFPVLQMLYNQGMMVPKHPNNTGEKPLLIGLERQIERQLNYIHRGNYGLLSEEELLAAGASEVEAREWMRIKLHFAFGRMRSISEIVDQIAIDHRKTEIRNGVSVHRTGFSKYRFEYQGEFVDVDMELSQNSRYASPYPLVIRKTFREYFSVIHSGEGDGWDIDRPCMGSIVCIQGRLYLIDTGPNLEAILNSLSVSVNELSGVFHTHCHDDHFCGLTALLSADHKLKHYATPVVRASISKNFTALMGADESLFERFFECIDLTPSVWNQFESFDVMPIISPHPVETSAFSFRVLGRDGYKTYTHLADIAAHSVLDNMVTSDNSAPGITADYCATVKERYANPANLKKIDIGGGLIHGNSTDFCEDRSEKIVLAHTARALTADEMQIGSGADVGTEDILIRNLGADYYHQIAAENLRKYFPDKSSSVLQVLLNNEIRVFNPHEILVREGQSVEHVFLVVSGNVDRFKRSEDVSFTMTAGSVLGELWAIKEIDAYVTYRAASYVRALMIPVDLYRKFVDEYGQRAMVERLADKRKYLRRTAVFGDGMTYEMQNLIAGLMEPIELENGPVAHFGADTDHLYLLEEGILKRMIGDNVTETLRPGDIYNEGCSVFGWTSKSQIMSIGPAKVWRIPVETFQEVPIVVWKLFEIFRGRIRMIPESAMTTDNIL